MLKYIAYIKKENNHFIVSFPKFPNINTYGETLDDALLNATEALNGSLEVDFERGFNFPKPDNKLSNRELEYLISVTPTISLAYYLRLSRGKLTQAELAKKIGVSYQSYQKLEHPAKCNPTVKTLNKIAGAMGKELTIELK